MIFIFYILGSLIAYLYFSKSKTYEFDNTNDDEWAALIFITLLWPAVVPLAFLLYATNLPEILANYYRRKND